MTPPQLGMSIYEHLQYILYILSSYDEHLHEHLGEHLHFDEHHESDSRCSRCSSCSSQGAHAIPNDSAKVLKMLMCEGVDAFALPHEGAFTLPLGCVKKEQRYLAPLCGSNPRLPTPIPGAGIRPPERHTKSALWCGGSRYPLYIDQIQSRTIIPRGSYVTPCVRIPRPGPPSRRLPGAGNGAET